MNQPSKQGDILEERSHVRRITDVGDDRDRNQREQEPSRSESGLKTSRQREATGDQGEAAQQHQRLRRPEPVCQVAEGSRFEPSEHHITLAEMSESGHDEDAAEKDPKDGIRDRDIATADRISRCHDNSSTKKGVYCRA